jgi:hypothetical protein
VHQDIVEELGREQVEIEASAAAVDTPASDVGASFHAVDANARV